MPPLCPGAASGRAVWGKAVRERCGRKPEKRDGRIRGERRTRGEIGSRERGQNRHLQRERRPPCWPLPSPPAPLPEEPVGSRAPRPQAQGGHNLGQQPREGSECREPHGTLVQGSQLAQPADEDEIAKQSCVASYQRAVARPSACRDSRSARALSPASSGMDYGLGPHAVPLQMWILLECLPPPPPPLSFLLLRGQGGWERTEPRCQPPQRRPLQGEGPWLYLGAGVRPMSSRAGVGSPTIPARVRSSQETVWDGPSLRHHMHERRENFFHRV